MRMLRDTITRLLVVATVFGVEGLECPNHCFCYTWDGLVRTDCVRRNLINTFLGISYRTQILDLSHNVISILHGNEFLSVVYPKCQLDDIARAKIHGPQMFSQNYTATYTFDKDANLKQLLDLRLSNNQLHKIDKYSFNGLHYLIHLDLSFNSIEYLNPSTFRFNPNLKTLNVSFNPLSLKADEPFISVAPSVWILDMANCLLDFVSPLTFSDLTSLRVLNITRNRIQKLKFSEGMKNLKYLDVTENEIPCNKETDVLIQSLIEQKIRFKDFCETSQKMQMIEVTEREENLMEVSLHQGGNENLTQHIQPQRSLLSDVSGFLQSIPAFYAIICGIQLGVFIGSFSTYICMKKSRKRHADEGGTAESRGYRHREFDNLSSALIPLNTPPGTPPSPYHSRFFPSSFSLSAT